jgi:2,4-dienoyl-CoA reductase-like NADH-dependent reductase (Old Yellow Enzyme family)
MVLEEIRRQAGDKFIVGMRYVIDEGDEAGLTLEEGIEMARLFERAGMLDFFNAIYGAWTPNVRLPPTICRAWPRPSHPG